MENIKALITFLQIIIPIGGAGRIAFCINARSADPDEAQSYTVRARNVVIFIILADTIGGLMKLAFNYFT